MGIKFEYQIITHSLTDWEQSSFDGAFTIYTFMKFSNSSAMPTLPLPSTTAASVQSSV